MLARLHIENAAVIEKADLELVPGFNVLTGETGAGKSILIDSINLVLGERVSRDIVRAGAQSALVSALFTDVSPAVCEAVEALGFSCEDGALLLQRELSADGRGSARVSGRPATASILREIGRLLVNTHGQHDNQALLDPEWHLRYLDRFGAAGEKLAEYREAYAGQQRVRAEIAKLDTDEAEKARRADLLAYQLEEIDAAELSPGEDEELAARKTRVQNSEKIATAVAEAYEALTGGDDSSGARGLLEEAADSLERAAAWFPELAKLAERLRDTAAEAEDCAETLRDTAEQTEFDPAELENIEERLDVLYRLKRKYGASVEEILAYAQKAREELETIEHADETLQRLQNELSTLQKRVKKLADGLTELRLSAAKGLEERISGELAFLDMPGTRFAVQFTPLPEPGPNGGEHVEFLIAANPGSPPRPLARIASGGELSRVMLAIKNALADNDEIETAIFDEIDAGVSGRAAQKIGKKLREVSMGRQVVCVTHLAQIASQAHRHILIEKRSTDNNTYTSLTTLDFDGRRRELARIIGGADITPVTLETAGEMLAGAGVTPGNAQGEQAL